MNPSHGVFGQFNSSGSGVIASGNGGFDTSINQNNTIPGYNDVVPKRKPKKWFFIVSFTICLAVMAIVAIRLFWPISTRDCLVVFNKYTNYLLDAVDSEAVLARPYSPFIGYAVYTKADLIRDDDEEYFIRLDKIGNELLNVSQKSKINDGLKKEISDYVFGIIPWVKVNLLSIKHEEFVDELKRNGIEKAQVLVNREFEGLLGSSDQRIVAIVEKIKEAQDSSLEDWKFIQSNGCDFADMNEDCENIVADINKQSKTSDLLYEAKELAGQLLIETIPKSWTIGQKLMEEAK